jgi:serine phosphatase RsbU (regulator of sigma subunit)
VQRELLPKKHPTIPSLDIAGFCKPAREIGGDYYDYIPIDSNRIGIVIADVSGKGLPAAIYMTLTKGIVRSKAEELLSPKAVLIKVNRLLYQFLWRDAFVTMFYGVLDLKHNRFTYARAGHNPPIYLNGNKETYAFLESKGIALGLADGKKFINSVEEKSCNLKSNDLIVFYTDGVIEAMNKTSNVFGEKRLVDLILYNRHKTCEKLINTISKQVSQFAGESLEHDDMTMVSLKIT